MNLPVWKFPVWLDGRWGREIREIERRSGPAGCQSFIRALESNSPSLSLCPLLSLSLCPPLSLSLCPPLSLCLYLPLSRVSNPPLSLDLCSSLSGSLPSVSGSLSPFLGLCPLKCSIFPADAPGTLGGVAELPGTASAGVRANQLCCAAVLFGATWTIKPKLALKVEVLSVLRGSEGICMSEQYVKGAIPADSVLA